MCIRDSSGTAAPTEPARGAGRPREEAAAEEAAAVPEASPEATPAAAPPAAAPPAAAPAAPPVPAAPPLPDESTLGGLDGEFLAALPPEVRSELVSTNVSIARFNEAVSSIATASSGDRGPPDDPMDPIDPEFLSALPPEMQAEVIQQQTREYRRQMRDRAARHVRAAADLSLIHI